MPTIQFHISLNCEIRPEYASRQHKVDTLTPKKMEASKLETRPRSEQQCGNIKSGDWEEISEKNCSTIVLHTAREWCVNKRTFEKLSAYI